MIRRRKLLAALGAAALSAAFPSLAQQRSKPWRIGVLASRSRPSSPDDPYASFAKGMSEFGYVEGKDYVYDWVYADGHYERLSELAAELVRRKVDIIVATSSVGAQAAHAATRTIPIVAASALEPVTMGLATSLARPGGNVTGLAGSGYDKSPKYLELLIAAVPKLSRVTILVNPASPTHNVMGDFLRSAAQKLDLQLRSRGMRSTEDIEPGFAAMAREGVQGLIVLPDAFFFLERRRLADQATKYRLPTVCSQEEYADAGSLMSYGQSLADYYRYSASLVDKILKGAKPGDLPFEQPTRFTLVINRKTAKAIGLAIPQELLLRADRVIE